MFKIEMKKDKTFKGNDTDLQLLTDITMLVLDKNKDGKLSFQEIICPPPIFSRWCCESSFFLFLSNVFNIIQNNNRLF